MNRCQGRLALLAGALAMAGCATTGDPRQGGLFGWSEEQAMARRDALGQDEKAAHRQLAIAQDRTAALSSEQAALTTTATDLEGELNRLLEENSKLDAQLRGLMQSRRLKEGQLTRLRGILADNAKARSVPRGAASSQVQAPATRSRVLGDQNARLHREVMILLQQ